MTERPPGREPLPHDLGRTVEKLKKINAALVNRVERSMDHQANAFSLFQTAISQDAQIRARTEELNQALSKLAHANLELGSARDAAERANMFKTRFFTAVGHDLLQPLHAARLMLSELMDAQEAPEDVRLAQNISNALLTIEELLATILDISKLEAGVFVPNIQAVALGGTFDRLAGSFEPMTRQKRLAFRCRATNLGVRSDPLMLRRMIQNLLANAAHYTRTGGILLGARRRGDRVVIEVWDTGPGVPAQERDQIFQEFHRGSTSTRSGVAGFGLGLSIVRRMADALGHELLLESRLGKGSRFSIVAPYASAAAAAELSSPAPTNAVNLVAKPLIVIDNDLAVLEAMQVLFTRWGADVRLARDLDEVAEIMADPSFAPEFIVADYHLDNDVLGTEAIARIRAGSGRDIPAVLMTADRSQASTDAAAAARCELLHKPVRPAELRALMQFLLS